MRRPVVTAAWLVLLATLLLAIGWGAHAPHSWDVDNIAPGSVLKGLAARFGPGWHSSYGPVPYLIVGALYAPVLLFLRVTGELGVPVGEYPWGFRRPDLSVGLLILLARLVCVTLAMGLAWLALRERWTASARDPNPSRAAWLLPVLLAGSPAFVYYARTSNVDMFCLFMLALTFHFAGRDGGWRTRAAAGMAAALAVCSKEQAAPFAVAAAMAAAWSALSAPGPRAARWRGALAVAMGAGIAYAVVWGLPFNLEGWTAHHRFLFEQARYPRAFPATPPGFLALAARAAEWSPVSLGWPVIVGALLACLRPALWRGLAPRAVGAAIYVAGFLAVIGYVYPRFLLPLMLLALPLALRGWNEVFDRARAWRGPALAVLLVLAASGGPLLGAAQLQDTRLLAAERLSRLRPEFAAGTPPRVEILGNPRFQARVPAGYAVTTYPVDSLGRVAAGPLADVVLMSGFDRYHVEGDTLLRRRWLDRLNDPQGDYELVWDLAPAPWSGWMRGLPVSPVVWGWKRR